MKYGKLTVIGPDPNRKYSDLVQCDCGSPAKSILRGNLVSGRTKSCGCLLNTGYTRHGLRNHHLYPIWLFMRRTAKAQGLLIQPEWSDFAVFLAELGERPEGTRLTRTNKHKGFFRENVSWK